MLYKFLIIYANPKLNNFIFGVKPSDDLLKKVQNEQNNNKDKVIEIIENIVTVKNSTVVYDSSFIIIILTIVSTISLTLVNEVIHINNELNNILNQASKFTENVSNVIDYTTEIYNITNLQFEILLKIMDETINSLEYSIYDEKLLDNITKCNQLIYDFTIVNGFNFL
jgi:hypothetical protein